jgi:hypothetical protein
VRRDDLEQDVRFLCLSVTISVQHLDLNSSPESLLECSTVSSLSRLA